MKFKSYIAKNALNTSEEILFARERYDKFHDDVVSVNVYIFLVETGCIEYVV
jgi:hypothetical protein